MKGCDANVGLICFFAQSFADDYIRFDNKSSINTQYPLSLVSFNKNPINSVVW